MFGLAFQIIAFSLFFVFGAYACIFADPETSDVGRLCSRTIPSTIFRLLERSIGQKRLSRLSKLADHAFQIFYLFVVLGSWSIVFFYGYPEIEASSYVASYHQYVGYAVFVLCMGSWHYACSVGPGNVTARTMPLFDHYEYDGILYTDRLCPTLKIRKIARSKYDRCTGRHVPRFDHFCGWLNQAVGERNHRWFLLFLSTQVGMCCYGTWAMAWVLYGKIMEKDLLNATFFNALTGAEVEADYFIVFHYLFARHMQICAVLLLMSVMSAFLSVFLAFHVYIASRNMTTNEYFKWRSVRKWHKKERRKYERALRDGMIGSKKGDAGGALSKQVPDGDVGCTGPVGGEGEPSSDVIADDEIFDPGPVPKNIYNKGLMANWYEVFFPLSSREDAIQRYRSALRNGSGKSNGSENCSSDEKMLKPKAI